MQSKKNSAIETLVNTLSGSLVSYILTLTVLPLFDMYPTHGDALGLTIIFTIASLIRSYLIRRCANFLDQLFTYRIK